MVRGIMNPFDRFAEEYDRWFETSKGRILFQIEVEAVKIFMDDVQPPFLEIGVGTGIFSSALQIRFGIDTSYEASSIAKKKGTLVALAKGENLPFKDETFGAVFILFTLCFVDDPINVLKEAYRSLRQGARVILGFINKRSPWGQVYIRKKEEGHSIYSYAKFYDPDEIEEFFVKIGFKNMIYSSTLLQPPSENSYFEKPHRMLLSEAGFICISGNKE